MNEEKTAVMEDSPRRAAGAAIAPVLVLGVGNILMGDEGLGVRAVEALAETDLPEDVEIFDGGTTGADLIDVLAERRKVIVIDAVEAPVPPGTIMRFGSEDFARRSVTMMSLHQVGILDALAMTRHIGCAPEEVVIFGVKPKTVRLGVGLSDEITDVISTVVDLVGIELDAPV